MTLRATLTSISRYYSMTSYHPAMHEVFRADPHEVAMPYRSDGVARALQATFVANTLNVPPEMFELLAALDANWSTGRHSKS